MYYPDLSKYEYSLATPLEYVRNIGWLEGEYEYLVGETPPELLQKLKDVLIDRRLEVNIYRGIHVCSVGVL